MKHQTLFHLLLLILLSACDPASKSVSQEGEVDTEKDYTIVLEDGLYIEQFDSTNTADNRYTANNQTYRAGNKLTYDYYYEDRNGARFKFEENEGASELDFRERAKAWSFVPIDSPTERTIDQVILTVKKGLEPMNRSNPDYNQTVISYNYPQVNGEQKFSSSTGVIENEKNIWAHPPRDRFFQILELNPFPFIQAPYEIGNKWTWSLGIGSFWGDERWKIWEGRIENQYTYEITDKRKIELALGTIACSEIQSTATSRIGTTQLTAYFHPEYGFVKLDYTNIDSSRTVLELINFEPAGVDISLE